MKKYLILFIVAVSTSLFVGCDLETDHVPPNYVSFEDTSLAFDVHENESESYEVTLYTGNITGNDRTFEINVEGASTLDAGAYTVPSSVTVPANTNEATFNVDVTGSGIDNAGDVLVLSLGQEEGLYTGNNLTLNIGKICDFDASSWAGTYSVSEVFTAGNNAGLSLAAAFGESYQVEMEANPADPYSVILQNSEGFDQYFVDGTILTFNACVGVVSISSGNIAVGFGNLTMTSSSFDPETRTVTVNGTLGNFGAYRYILSPVGEDNGEGEEGEGEEGEGEESEGEEGEGDGEEGEDDGDEDEG